MVADSAAADSPVVVMVVVVVVAVVVLQISCCCCCCGDIVSPVPVVVVEVPRFDAHGERVPGDRGAADRAQRLVSSRVFEVLTETARVEEVLAFEPVPKKEKGGKGRDHHGCDMIFSEGVPCVILLHPL